MIYYCDDCRHLVCKPYTIENLHKMAEKLNIKNWWFHKKKNGLSHYDIPIGRIKEITEKCELVSSKDIIKIIRNEKG